MKKLFLLLVSGALSFAAAAQNVMMKQSATPMPMEASNQVVPAYQMQQMFQNSEVYKAHHTRDTKRSGPTAIYNDWYDLWDQNFVGGVSQYYYYAIYPDSSLIDDYAGGTDHTFTEGIGMSFDPTDSGYTYNATAYSVGHALPLTGQSYTIDSYYVPIQYLRNNPTTTVIDSVIIEIIVTSAGTLDSGAYNLQYPASPSFYQITYDESPRFGSVHYNNGLTAPYNVAPYINDCYFDSIYTRKYRYALPLNSINWDDTSSNGCINLNQAAHLPSLPLSPAINIYSSNTHVVSYVSFKSGHVYSFGTHTSVANIIHCFAGEPNSYSSFFMQSASNPSLGYLGSAQASMFATNQTRYDNAGYTYDFHNVLIPGFDYPYPGRTVTFDQFHVKWTCTTPTVSAISGTSVLCTTTPFTYSDATLGGTWSVSNADAYFSGAILTGSSSGLDTVTYTVTNACGSATATATVLVMLPPTVAAITGPSVVCTGASVTLSDATLGGVWTSGSTPIATIDPSTGLARGVSPGFIFMEYTVTNACGSANSTYPFNVYLPPVPGTITGGTSVCVSSTVALSDAASGGAWSVANGNASVSAGVVTGVSAGTDVISYTVTTLCAAASATSTVTVNPLPVPVVTNTGGVLSTTSYVGYQWNLVGTGAISGATNSTYTVILSGVYDVTVTDANGCTGTSGNVPATPALNIQNTNAVNNDVKIYPNPAQTVVNIVSSNKVNVQLMTMDGRVIMDKQDVTSIDISNLANGNYMLVVYDAVTNLKLKTDRLVKMSN